MKKKYCATLATGAAISTWCGYRNRKYHVCPELHFVNKLSVPGFVLNANTMRLANRSFAWISKKLPTPAQGIER